MLFGSFTHHFDEKNRLVIPSRFRKELSDKLFVMRGFDGCISLYGEKAFSEYIEKLNKMEFANKNARDILRMALSSVFELEMDKVYRVQIPTQLIDMYNISKEVEVVGVIDHLEIWSINKWNEYKSTNNNTFEEKFQDLVGDKHE